jgi:hypothetical protein
MVLSEAIDDFAGYFRAELGHTATTVWGRIDEEILQSERLALVGEVGQVRKAGEDPVQTRDAAEDADQHEGDPEGATAQQRVRRLLPRQLQWQLDQRKREPLMLPPRLAEHHVQKDAPHRCILIGKPHEERGA